MQVVLSALHAGIMSTDTLVQNYLLVFWFLILFH